MLYQYVPVSQEHQIAHKHMYCRVDSTRTGAYMYTHGYTHEIRESDPAAYISN